MGNGSGVHIRELASGQTRFERIEPVTRHVKGVEAPCVAHARPDGQGFTARTCTKVHHHFSAVCVQYKRQQLRAFVLHFDCAALEGIQSRQGRLALNAQPPRRVGVGSVATPAAFNSF